MALVRFPSYRVHEVLLTEANNAMMALLAGSQLAANTLLLTKGSERLLPEIFPEVRHIRRVNLKVSQAEALLNEAEAHLGAMAVPYALALHEDFVFECLRLLQRGGLCGANAINNASAKTMHETFATRSSTTLPFTVLEQFHLLRLLRNSLIHSGGRPNAELIGYVGTVSQATMKYWKRATQTDIAQVIATGERITFGHGELIASLASTRHLAEEMNRTLQSTLDRNLWADIAFEDFATEHGLPTDRGRWEKKLRGWARFLYGALSLTDGELRDAIARTGL